jgi:cytochrome c6
MGNSDNHILEFSKKPPRKLSALRNLKPICLSCAALSLFMLPLAAQDTAASLYKTKCALCHAPDGSGSGPVGKQLNVPNLRLRAQAQTAEQWIQITEDGKGKMPAYKGRLSEDQIRQLVTYTREVAKTK